MSAFSALTDVILITLGKNKLARNPVGTFSLGKDQNGLLFYYMLLG